MAVFFAKIVIPRSRFEVIRIHNTVDKQLIVTENSRLTQHSIDQGGFSMVNVRDDGYISNIFTFCQHISSTNPHTTTSDGAEVVVNDAYFIRVYKN